MMEHTPGPWEVLGYNIKCQPTKDDAGTFIAEMISSRCPNETAANAKLIAAAPEMLEALEYTAKLIKTARQYFPKSIKNSSRFQLENCCATINKAIYKARGE